MRKFTLLDLTNNNINSDDLYESSNLGLNNKVKKKFSDVDAIDNITTLDLSQCYEYVKANISNELITLEKARSSFLDVSKSKYYIKVCFSNRYMYDATALYIGYVIQCQGRVGIFINDTSMSSQLLKKFRKYLCNKNFEEVNNYPIFCSKEQENLPLDLLEYAVSLAKEETLEK